MLAEKVTDYAVALADAALDIGAIRLWPKDGPFQWASGFFMPIYNDNRLLLARSQYRKIVAEGFRDVLQRQGVNPDLVGGTSTSGIAPASSLAQLLGVPVALQNGGKIYVMDKSLTDSLRADPEHFARPLDIVVSTCPFSIPPAVMDANDHGRPFAYVRQDQKDHGLRKKIEGLVRRNDTAMLVDCHVGDSYVFDAQDTLEEAGVIVGVASSKDISDVLKPSDVKGRTIVQVEDLVSTGGSCIEEVKEYRLQGAEVPFCVAIFSYGLEKADAKFREAKVQVFPLLTYDVLLSRARDRRLISEGDLRVLGRWREDPFGWGEKQGYLPVKK